jgi:predicted site-specific integrase-resolvase
MPGMKYPSKYVNGRIGNRLLTSGQATRLLNVQRKTLQIWGERGRITTFRIGLAAHRRYREEDIAALLNQVTHTIEINSKILSNKCNSN